MYIHTHTQTHICIYTHTHRHTHTHTYTDIHMYTQTQTHIYIYTHTHRHTCSELLKIKKNDLITSFCVISDWSQNVHIFCIAVYTALSAANYDVSKLSVVPLLLIQFMSIGISAPQQ